MGHKHFELGVLLAALIVASGLCSPASINSRPSLASSGIRPRSQPTATQIAEDGSSTGSLGATLRRAPNRKTNPPSVENSLPSASSAVSPTFARGKPRSLTSNIATGTPSTKSKQLNPVDDDLPDSDGRTNPGLDKDQLSLPDSEATEDTGDDTLPAGSDDNSNQESGSSSPDNTESDTSPAATAPNDSSDDSNIPEDIPTAPRPTPFKRRPVSGKIPHRRPIGKGPSRGNAPIAPPKPATPGKRPPAQPAAPEEDLNADPDTMPSPVATEPTESDDSDAEQDPEAANPGPIAPATPGSKSTNRNPARNSYSTPVQNSYRTPSGRKSYVTPVADTQSPTGATSSYHIPVIVQSYSAPVAGYSYTGQTGASYQAPTAAVPYASSSLGPYRYYYYTSSASQTPGHTSYSSSQIQNPSYYLASNPSSTSGYYAYPTAAIYSAPTGYSSTWSPASYVPSYTYQYSYPSYGYSTQGYSSSPTYTMQMSYA